MIVSVGLARAKAFITIKAVGREVRRLGLPGYSPPSCSLAFFRLSRTPRTGT